MGEREEIEPYESTNLFLALRGIGHFLPYI